MFIEHRHDPRQPVALPVRLDSGVPAIARNVSASGMFIEWHGPDPMGGTVYVEMDLVDAGMRLEAEGEIVRVEHADGKTGIGVKLRDARLEPIAA